MADKRMMAREIIENDTLLDLPQSARLLYMHLILNADDDGFVDSSNKVMRISGTGKKDIDALTECGYLIRFRDNLYVITHWNVHNTVRKDMYKPSKYQAELKALIMDPKTKVYQLRNDTVTDSLQTSDVAVTEPSHRLDKIRLDKNRLNKEGGKSSHFVPPTLQEVQEYISANGYHVNAETFINFYESKGWMVGKSKMKDWKSALRGWEARDKANAKPKTPVTQFHQFQQGHTEQYDEFIKKLEGN